VSDNQVESQSEPTTECSICGHVPGPFADCEICHGNTTFTQSRAFTRTEESRGAKGDPERYSRTGNVSPKIVMVPGSFDPSRNNS
jgi:hypothetical protein